MGIEVQKVEKLAHVIHEWPLFHFMKSVGGGSSFLKTQKNHFRFLYGFLKILKKSKRTANDLKRCLYFLLNPSVHVIHK